MNLERLISMVVNQVIRKLVNLVVDRGFNMASRQMKPADDLEGDDPAPTKGRKELAARNTGIQDGKRDLF